MGFYANVKAVATTCALRCNVVTPAVLARRLDFTHMVVKDILVDGIADSDIREELLEWSELDTKSEKEIVQGIGGVYL